MADRCIATAAMTKPPRATIAAGTSLPIASPNTNAGPTTIDDLSLDRLRRECSAPMPHPDASTLRQQADRALSWLLDQFTHLSDLRVGRSGTRQEMETLLREPPPEIGQEFTRVLGEYQASVAPFAMRIDHPRFFAFIPSGPTFYSILGELLASGTNPFAAVWLEACGPAQVELVVLDWFKEFLGYPAQASGILTSGGSEANLTALIVARETLPLDRRDRAVLYVSQQRHWSVDRAAKVIGFRPDQVHPVPEDAQWRLTDAALIECVEKDRHAGLEPWAVVANAGATNTGAVDPLVELGALCREQRLWFHVDAAYGWAAVLDAEGEKVLKGIDRADSITLDPHKWLAQTFEVGCVLVREGRLLTQTFAMRPDYMQDVAPGNEEVNFADQGIALTRRFRALKIWLSIKVLGVRWFRALIGRSCRLAELAEALIERSPVLELLSRRQLSIVCFRFVPKSPKNVVRDARELDDLNLAVVDEVRRTGRVFISSTRLGQRVALRLCFVNWRTTAADVVEALALIEQIGERLTGGV
jgi:aromatic-L-amino-acid/L-tryptophan decarboxylase